jgi:small subunit ribosomal protein S4
MRLIGTLDTSEGHGMREKDDLLRSLHLKGFISKDAILDDILSLNAETILNRRLQAMVYYKGLACSLKQARQLVTHGHICIGDQKVSIPSYPVNRDEEEVIQYHPSSDLNNPEHEIRKAIDGRRELAEYAEEEVDPEATKPFADEVNEAAEVAPSAETEVVDGGEA